MAGRNANGAKARRDANGANGAQGPKTYSLEEVRSMIKPHQEALDTADAEIARLKDKLDQAKDEFAQVEDEFEQSEAELEDLKDVNGHLKAELVKAQAIIAAYHAMMRPLGINPVANEFIPSGASCTASASDSASDSAPVSAPVSASAPIVENWDEVPILDSQLLLSKLN